ncbi:MAG: hypothetical protein V4584_07125 [Verrucomicrobiota bacterium]
MPGVPPASAKPGQLTAMISSTALDLPEHRAAVKEAVRRQDMIAEDNRRLAKALVRQGKAVEAQPYAQRAVVIYTSLGVLSDIAEAQATLAECEGGGAVE